MFVKLHWFDTNNHYTCSAVSNKNEALMRPLWRSEKDELKWFIIFKVYQRNPRLDQTIRISFFRAPENGVNITGNHENPSVITCTGPPRGTQSNCSAHNLHRSVDCYTSLWSKGLGRLQHCTIQCTAVSCTTPTHQLAPYSPENEDKWKNSFSLISLRQLAKSIILTWLPACRLI